MTQTEEHPLEQDITATTQDQSGKQDTGVADNGAQVRKSKIKEWWKKLWKDEFELTIFFPGSVTTMPDGSKIESNVPKTWKVSQIGKITPTHFVFFDTEKRKHVIKTTAPVGYNLIKIY